MKIKIKRATTEGLKDADGDFFEENGMQFCLVKHQEFYYCIELSTGCNVKSYYINDYTKKEAIDFAKGEISGRTKKEWKDALNKVSKEYNFSLPVNAPVLKT